MKTVKLNIDERVFDKVMFLLTNLPKNDVKVNIETKEGSDSFNKLKLKAVSLKTKNFKFDRDEANAR